MDDKDVLLDGSVRAVLALAVLCGMAWAVGCGNSGDQHAADTVTYTLTQPQSSAPGSGLMVDIQSLDPGRGATTLPLFGELQLQRVSPTPGHSFRFEISELEFHSAEVEGYQLEITGSGGVVTDAGPEHPNELTGEATISSPYGADVTLSLAGIADAQAVASGATPELAGWTLEGDSGGAFLTIFLYGSVADG